MAQPVLAERPDQGMTGSKKPRTEEEVLQEALVYAMKEPQNLDLHHAAFGRYADGSGCYWLLQFIKRVDNGNIEAPVGGIERRLAAIVRAWVQGFGSVTASPPDSDPCPPGHQ